MNSRFRSPRSGCLRKHTSRQRKGMVTVEFALTVPILFLFVLGAIEFSRANMLVNTCEIAATEGARRGIIPGATAQECRQAAERELDIIRVTDRQVTVDPSVITPDTEFVTVDVSAPMNIENGYMIPKFFTGKTIRQSITLRREEMNTE